MSSGLHVKYPLFLPDFNEALNVFDRILKNTQMSDFMNIHAMGTELFHVNGWANMMKLIVAFCNFVNTLKKLD